MDLRTAAARSAGLAIALVLVSGTVAPVRAESNGEITLRLELRGDVPASDSFSIGIHLTNSTLTGLGGFFCGPPDVPYTQQGPVCRPGTYDVTSDLPIGTTMEFVFARFIEYRGSAEGAQVLYEGSATVSQAPQVFTVVFDYSRGGTTPALPDTAMAASE